MPIRRNLIRRRLMNASCESREKVDLPLHDSIRIMTCETHLCVRTVADKKILRDPVDSLHVRTVATGAFDVAVDQLHRLRRIGRFALCDERCCQIGRIFKWKDKTERMRAGQGGSERIDAVERADHRQLAIG